MLTDVFRHKNPDLRKYTFSKGQTRNHTKARLDYFFMNEDALDSVVKVGIGRENALSDHCPIYIHLKLSKVVRGRGFWKFNNAATLDVFVRKDYGINLVGAIPCTFVNNYAPTLPPLPSIFPVSKLLGVFIKRCLTPTP